jgi:DNA-binding NarL/FixJ family response regulator
MVPEMQKSRSSKNSDSLIRVLLVDDHTFFRQCLRSQLEKRPDIEIIGEANDGRVAVELVRKLLPDIVIMDVCMPNLNGIEATRHIRSEFTQVKVIGLSSYCDIVYVAGMFKAGASDYMLKDCSSEELVESIRAVSRGETYLSPKVNQTIISDYNKLLSEKNHKLLERLSVREREVLQLLTEGKSAKQIALELHVGIKAIESNRRRIMEKLDIYDIPSLVKFAITSGITSLEKYD